MEDFPTTGKRNWTGIALGAAALLALGVGDAYFYNRTGEMQDQIVKMQAAHDTDLRSLKDTISSAADVTRQTLEELRGQLGQTRREAAAGARSAGTTAQQHADEILQKLLDQEKQQQEALATELGGIKQATATAQAKTDSVANEVTAVKTNVSQTRSDLDQTISQLKSVQGDLGVHSGLIATNGKELAALRELGERNYVEFNVTKTNKPEHVGDIMVQLRKVDPKRNRYAIDVVADDKRVEKKDKAINEPVQFYLAKAKQPYEIVVNRVEKDRIVGYLATPKVMMAQR
jgi:chromosome segregation ATPase